ncbi:MAG: hypothetical protein NTV86_01935 [Planctomycetota bacterium]|nr:hypothetical protein [Planctomycetota bacterium]
MAKRDLTKHLRGWNIVAENPGPELEAYFESVMTLGNGLWGVRGSREESRPAEVSRPLTLMAEVYDRPKCPPGLPAKYRDPARLVAMPNAMFIDFDDGAGPMSANPRGIVSETRTLDMKHGLLERVVRYKSKGGRVTRIVSRRLASQARPHLAAIQWSFTPENYSGPVTITSLIDGTATHVDGLEQMKELEKGRDGETVWMLVQTAQFRTQVAVAARHSLSRKGEDVAAKTRAVKARRKTGLVMRLDAVRGQTTALEKVVVMHNSLRQAGPLERARVEAQKAPAFEALRREHVAVWADYWRDCDVVIEGDRFIQTMVRFWVFHLLQSASKNNVTVPLSASIPAKTLSGWGYGGRIFWDTEIYMLPFFSQQYPEIAESLLRYRHDRLAGGQIVARRAGCQGAKFPWESAGTGLEECPKWIHRKDGSWWRWRGGEQQIHVTSDVAFGLWQHYLATGDRGFLNGPGLDILVATARYWASRVRQDKSGAHVLKQVIGPDEHHQCVNNSVYTNSFARWNLTKAADLIGPPGKNPKALARFGLTAKELTRWRQIAATLKINFDPATGLYEQFDGYFQHPVQTIKQADVLLLLYLLPEMRTSEVFRLNFDRYHPITKHTSSLSPAVHVMFALDVGYKDKAYEYEFQAGAIDGLAQPGLCDDGLHAASMGGGWSSIVAGFGGVRVKADCLAVAPELPAKWKRLAFSTVYQGLRLRFEITPKRLVIEAQRGGAPVALEVLGRRVRIKPGQRIDRALSGPNH